MLPSKASLCHLSSTSSSEDFGAQGANSYSLLFAKLRYWHSNFGTLGAHKASTMSETATREYANLWMIVHMKRNQIKKVRRSEEVSATLEIRARTSVEKHKNHFNALYAFCNLSKVRNSSNISQKYQSGKPAVVLPYSDRKANTTIAHIAIRPAWLAFQRI